MSLERILADHPHRGQYLAGTVHRDYTDSLPPSVMGRIETAARVGVAIATASHRAAEKAKRLGIKPT